jgi:predicted metal-dependent peptidase
MTTAVATPTLTPARKAKLELRLSKAKTNLILSHPFVGTVALSMPFVLDFNVPTAATNGKRVVFNPDFIEQLSEDELLFLVAHECFHPMLDHTHRRGERQARRWNMAADYVINQLLTDEKIGRMPKQGLLDSGIYQAGNGNSEGIYAILPEQDESGEGGYGGHGDPLDNCEDAPGSPAEAAQQAAEWKVKVAQAAQAAKMMGKMSANMQRIVDAVLRPRVDWRTVLQRFLVKARTDSRSWARFNRRFLPQGMYMPSISGEQMGEIVFAVDCSGSIGSEELNQFAAEMRNVQEDLMPTRIHVLYFDSAVCHADVFEQDNELTVAPHGGGGTDFAPVFEYMVEHGVDPVAVVFLTDLCCNSFGNEPACPVLWVTTHPGTAPFGEIVEM